MSRKLQNLTANRYFYIYNRGNNSIPIFPDAESVRYFFKKYDQYIGPVADTLAWCLLPNQFHLIVYLKDLAQIDQSQLEYRTVVTPKQLTHSLQFSHFFNSYTQAVNKKFKRTGALFEKPFARSEITLEALQQKIVSLHRYSRLHSALKNSYDEIMDPKTKRLRVDLLYDVFGSKKNLKTAHATFLTFDDFATFTKH